MNFIPSIQVSGQAASAIEKEPPYWFIFSGDKLLVDESGPAPLIPRFSDPASAGINILRSQYLGMLDGIGCFTAETEMKALESEGLSFFNLRALLPLFEGEWFCLAGRAFQIMDWDRTHQYCGRCGSAVTQKDGERAKECPKCGLVTYPRICPATITAVVRDGKLLLARHSRTRGNLYTVLAGFVEAGETLEECVHREIREETGIEVKNIRYFGSESWPFPNSMMIAFTAEYDSGEIKVDETEILEARWFSPDALPEVPGRWSISRKLIDWYVDTYK
ncbi:MAG: NAD(+) diphosphatase [Bacteroidota bacterium]